MKPPHKGIWWCNTHSRMATHINDIGERCCNPRHGNFTVSCRVVYLRMKLTLTQQTLVNHMQVHLFPLMRRPGGVWTTSDMLHPPPVWWSTKIVAALQEKGVLVNETSQPFSRGRFRLSEKWKTP